MKKSRFSEEKIIAVLKQAEASVKVSELVRKHGISEATFYNWKAKYGGLVTKSKLRVGRTIAKGDFIGSAGQTETSYVHVHFELLAGTSSKDWTKGRLNPVSVAGPLEGCRNSAAPR